MTQATPTNFWYFLIGGGFIGFWIFWGFMTGESDLEGWIVWGLFGLAVPAGFYAARLVRDNVRYAIWVGIGISIGILIGAAFYTADINFIAFFVTATGAGLIVAGIPDPRAPPESTGASPTGEPTDPARRPSGPAERPTWAHAPSIGQEQSSGGQQQHQEVRLYGDEYR